MDESKNTRLLRFRLVASGRCKNTQKRTKDGILNSKNFDSPILTENYLELMENQLSSSGIFPRTYFIGDPPEHPKDTCKFKNNEPENFEDRIIFMSMFNDIEWTKKEISERCISNRKKSRN